MRNQYNGIMSLAKMKSPFGHVVINKSLVTKFAENRCCHTQQILVIIFLNLQLYRLQNKKC